MLQATLTAVGLMASFKLHNNELVRFLNCHLRMRVVYLLDVLSAAKATG